MSKLGALVSLTKPRISILNVAMTAVGLALAGSPGGGTVVATLVGTLLLVGAANTLNMYLERDIDARMRRTRKRPLPAGILTPRTALVWGVAQALVAVPLLTFGANALTGLLGAFALVVYVLVYTPMKQHTAHAILVGAVPGAMPPLLGWTAASGSLSAAGLALFGVLFFWQIPHFIAITLFQSHDYSAAGLKVLPATHGEETARRAIVVTLVLQLLVTLILVPLGLGGPLYLAGAALMGAAMLGFGVWGMARGSGPVWAKNFFLATLAYLPLLFGLLVAS